MGPVAGTSADVIDLTGFPGLAEIIPVPGPFFRRLCSTSPIQQDGHAWEVWGGNHWAYLATYLAVAGTRDIIQADETESMYRQADKHVICVRLRELYFEDLPVIGS